MKFYGLCEIIVDLLPNCIENVPSKEGNELVRDYIDGCIHYRGDMKL